MATAKPSYAGATGTPFTITLLSKGSGVAQQSTFINNQSANLWLDALISGLTTVGSAAAVGDSYLLAAGYDGNNFPFGGAANLGATDAVVTANGFITTDKLAPLQYGQPVPGTSLFFLARIPTGNIAATTAIGFGQYGLSQCFQMGGLALPTQFAVVFVNGQGQAHDATGAHFAVYYNGIQQTIA